MSFCHDVKTELTNIKMNSPCCEFAFDYGLLLFGRAFSRSAISLSTEHEAVAELYRNAVKNSSGIQPEAIRSKSGKCNINIGRESECMRILESFGYTGQELSIDIKSGNIQNDCCKRAFLRGAFLSCGNLTNPEKEYHFEFAVSRYKVSCALADFIAGLDISVKTVKRKGNNIVYIKDSGDIEDMLTLMGAEASCLELMGIKMYKDMRNNINRKTNFETANISRTVEASCAQIEAIRTIEKAKGLSSLSDEIRELAILRLENPEMSLRELGENLRAPISRSGVNHRLNKLISIAEEIASD